MTMTVTEIDQLDWPWSVTAYFCQRFCDRQPTPQKIYRTSMGCEEDCRLNGGTGWSEIREESDIDTINDVAVEAVQQQDGEVIDQQRLAEQLVALTREKGWRWSARVFGASVPKETVCLITDSVLPVRRLRAFDPRGRLRVPQRCDPPPPPSMDTEDQHLPAM
jgi:hypothetical protein